MIEQNLDKKPPLLLEIKNICKNFVSKKSVIKAVDRVSFAIHRGETYALVGESGCGKTTTGRLILRLLDVDQGQILFEGIPISGLTKRKLRKKRHNIQVIFQNPYGSLNPRMKISALLAESISIRAEKPSNIQAEAERLLQSVGLEKEHLDKYPHEFSGGQRQRICIARAIATNPKLIICDEPVSALDLLVQAQILCLLQNLQKEYGFSYLFISHDLSVVRYMTDRIGVMCNGKIVEEGTRDEIFENPQHSYTRLLFASLPTLKNADAFTTTNIQKDTETYQKVLRDVKEHSSTKIAVSKTHYLLSD
ncbi:ATP-binding cassette domain-containing protein [Desulfotalea psychrophila]|uniref:Probable oligopeptide ABC transporter, ATP-binding protein n=1 Tax=Desulfotalea psychrophila (strain LSv54 / DSM 12343) TaxID=177439 RepID=Q6AP18_DESPS|nr:ATP-binding cassette domain-containing protein [Desulfotalea psychrophila]CAG35906.1 probable oligopeptide ABC transporter, ATP-binding protein [Desulfotalea psychrophila LSv54]